jgi:Uma2 family endonuclease
MIAFQPRASVMNREKMAAEPIPDWLRPPPGGFTADDLDRIPGLPPHTELIDGSLVFVSPQTNFHELVMRVLVNGLAKTAPSMLKVRREMTITLSSRQRPEPDVLVVSADADRGMEQTSYEPSGVVLVVEVVSADSEERDRKRKPQLYAEAGIPHFWRVENKNGEAVVFVYELDPATDAYGLAGVHRGRLKITAPFDIDVDLTEIDRL